MENNKLSTSYIQKYDEMSDTFVVVENQTEDKETKRRRFEPFSFFRKSKSLQEENINQRENLSPAKNEQERLAPQNSNQFQNVELPNQTPPQTNSAVSLSIEAYNKIKILSALYQNLSQTDPNNTVEYNNLIDETAMLEKTMLSIYQKLSGNSSIPAQNQTIPVLTGIRCRDIETTEKHLQSTLDSVIALERTVNVADINRQLAIIGLTLLSQKNKLSPLQEGCN